MYIFIINSIAGNGRAMKTFHEIQKDPLYSKKECRSFYTRYAGHAEEIASQVAEIYQEKIKCLIIVGGDGTVHEVFNGLKANSKIPLAFIPVGSGNDFARGCQLKERPQELFRNIINRPIYRPYWIGNFRTDFRKHHHRRIFVNSIGFGLDAAVAKLANQSVYKKLLSRCKLGSISYSIALFRALFTFKPQAVDLVLDDEHYSFNEVWMVTITNHPYFGGGMKLIPNAKINKDYHDLLVIDSISKLKILALFFTVFFGYHTRLKEVHTFKAKHIRISTERPIDFQADGETGTCKRCVIDKDSINRVVYSRKK